MKRPFTLWILVFWLLLLALGGLYGGIAMLLDPTGGILQMQSVLPYLLVPNYILPGLFLLFVMGLFPLVLVYALIARPHWTRLDALVAQFKHDWAWTATVGLALLLMGWLVVQAILMGFTWAIQYITAFTGLCILIFALVPPVERYYRKPDARAQNTPSVSGR
jgi:hypothetical protein